MKIKRILGILITSLMVMSLSGCYAIYFSSTVLNVKIVNKMDEAIYIFYDKVLEAGESYTFKDEHYNLMTTPFINFCYCVKAYHDEHKGEGGGCDKCLSVSKQVHESYYEECYYLINITGADEYEIKEYNWNK